MPAIDVALIMRMVYVVMVLDRLSPFWALTIGLILGVVALVILVGGQGTTLLEVLTPSVILLLLLLSIQPVFYRAALKNWVKESRIGIMQTRELRA